MKIQTSLLACCVVSMLTALPCYAELAVIVHPSNASSMDKDAITRIFLGKSRAFPSGGESIPIAFPEGTPESDEFSQSILGKTPKQLKAYWAKMIFTGKGTPPKQVPTAQEIVNLVANNPNFIGFVPAGSVSGSVKVVGKF